MYLLTLAYDPKLDGEDAELDIINYVGWRPYERTIGPSADSMQRLTFFVEGDFIEVQVLLDGLCEARLIRSFAVRGVASNVRKLIQELHRTAQHAP